MSAGTFVPVHRHRPRVVAARPDRVIAPRRHIAWLGVGVAGGFLVPYVLADRLEIQRDVYYGLYVLFVAGLFGAWLHDTGQSLRELTGRRPGLTLGLAAAFSALAVVMALKAEDATGHPGGLEFLGALAWRGVVYGLADGLLLAAFPIVVTYAAFAARERGRPRERLGRLGVGAVALLVSVAFTGIYHLGYADFRGEKVKRPMTGDLVWSPATLVTMNPIGAPIVHASMHVTAVAHSYDTDLFLPPH